MLREFKFLRRNPGKNSSADEAENVAPNPRDLRAVHAGPEVSRDPLNSIQDPSQNPNPTQGPASGTKGRAERTPSKSKRKAPDTNGTPEKQGSRVSSRHRFGRCQKHESINPSFEEACDDSTQLGRGASVGVGNGSSANAATPRSTRAMGRTNSTNYESNSTQNTPTRSVCKPPNPGFSVATGSRFPANGCGGRTGHFSVSAKGIPIPAAPSTIVNTVEVPHFDLQEDPSFWIDRNVQVIIRVRPLNFTEKSMYGYSRCLKQESAQSITWIGQPETRFTFDHVACETVDQELLFKMVGLPMVENCLSGYNSCMFAYGQTGSGKTYTMLGEMDELQIMPSPHRGLTARVFEFLFSRIRAQEKYRADERLKYSCKCSFLEIYNEQITDLLDPSSTNLLLREDVKKGGVYVENLSEFEVQTVSDILRLLAQGSSNRKVAATNMNRESSRSHSVFTCVIESRWEKDASANLRFARLNLVDLAGSERQKTSGAEGERLREAANINKSLSTLGHVIMVLVDVANGRPKHVPYRDSRLTFLLQDSLGGNSKTIIIANVSPSIGSAAETLNTLKFAQRAKLIQNNAVINEDSSGDVVALQHQIRLLKEELAVLKREKVSRSLSFGSTTTRDTQLHENVCRENNLEMDQCRSDGVSESKCIMKMSSKQLKSLETTLAGALRREQMAEASIKQLEAEIEQLNRLVRQREEDTRSTKMMLKFREDKIQRMESLVSGLIPVDTYLLEENRGLQEEIQLVQAKMDRNPEVTRFALENIRLLDQVRRFQDFYEEGERETLLAEVSQLRDEVLRNFDEVSKNYKCMSLNTPPKEITAITSENLQAEVLQNFDVVSKNYKSMSLHTPTKEITSITSEKDSLQAELKKSFDELEQCRINLQSCLKENSKLNREIDDLNCLLNDLKSEKHDQDGSAKPAKEFSQENPPSEPREIDEKKGENHASLMTHVEVDVHLLLELDILKIMLKEEKSVRGEIEEKAMWLKRDLDIANEKVMLTTRQCQDLKDELKEANTVIQALESQQILSINDMESLRNRLNNYVDLLNDKELEILSLKKRNELQNQHPRSHIDQEDPPLQKKLKLMQESLEKAKRLNMWYQSDRAFHASNEEEMDEVRKQVEVETAEVIVCLQEELVALQQQVENSNLKETESKNRVMLLETELIELQEKLVLTSKENETLGQMLEGKNEELGAVSREWEKLTCEIDDVLVGGHEALDDAAGQLGVISSLLPQKRTWICEQFAKMARLISEKDLLIEELNISLENLSRGRNDVESMLKSLKGAAMVITEAHQQEWSEKEREISLLMSEINSKTSIIEKLERRLKLGEDQISQTSICATAAFIIVNRLSEINTDHLSALRESSEVNLKKDGLLQDQATMIGEAKRQTENLRMEIESLEQNIAALRLKLSAELQRFCDLEQKLEDTGEDDSFKIMDKLAELKSGISALRLHISKCAEQVGSSEEKDTRRNSNCTSTIHNCEERAEVTQKTNKVDMQFIEDLESERCIKENISVYRSRMSSEDFYDVDLTIRLLSKEIETSVESLKGMQDQMANVRDEKENIRMIGEQRQKDKESLAAQVFSLQAAINNFEMLFQLKMVALNHKLQNVELNVQDVGTDWRQMKEVFELEIEDANMIVAQKSAEACCILRKFEENQETVREADIMINKLLTANGTMKLEIDELKKTQYGLILERNEFVSKIQHLQSSNDLKVQQCEELEKQLDENLMEMRSLVWELEGVSARVQVDFTKDFMSLSGEFHQLKSQLLESKQSLRSWLEDIWSEIIVKDCAVSALHSCHMGILLENVIGLNAENSFLHHGLRESNSAVADLRERNAKSRTELEMCMILKGKLLADIKSSFDHISRKVDETGVLDMKLTSFEKKIMDLQLQEELMLQRSDYMGSQLAILTKELDMISATSLLDQEKLLKKKEDMEYETEIFLINFLSKDFESVIIAFALKEALQKAERQKFLHSTVLENLKKQIIFLNVDAGFKDHILEDTKLEVAFLRSERQDLFSKISQISLKVSEGDEINKVLENEIQMLNDVASLNENLKGELVDAKARLSTQAQNFNSEREKYVEELSMKEMNLELCSNRISLLGVENEKLRSDIQLLEASIFGIQDDLGKKDAELSKMMCLEFKNKSLADKLMCLEAENKSLAEKNKNLETERCSILQDLVEKESEAEISLCGPTSLNMDQKNLQDEISVLEKLIANLQTDLELRNAELAEFVDRQSVIGRELSLKSHDIDLYVNEVNALMEENGFLKSKLSSLKHELLTASSVNITECIDSLKSANMVTDRMVYSLTDDVSTFSDKMLNESFENLEKASHFMEELQCLENLAEDLISENFRLRTELSRKEDVLEGLSFDLRLLQESASNVKDQRDEVEDMAASLEVLEGELSVKSDELNEVVAHGNVLQAQLQDKTDTISALRLELSNEQESLNSLSCKNHELRAQIEDALAEKKSTQEKLTETSKINDRLAMELLEMGSSLEQMNNSVASLNRNLNAVVSERDQLQAESRSLKEELEEALSRADENEAIAVEARQMAEARRVYVEEKEVEVKLLERSVEELESTVDVLEQKVDIVKGEAELQRLQREELELELDAVKHQLTNVESGDRDINRLLLEKEKVVQAQERIQILEREIAGRDAEIVQCHAHISELHLHAEAQASEYKQKLKALEAMADQVRTEGSSTHAINSSSNKLEKNTSRPRGSGSPFKCIGLGLNHQIKSDKDEELTVGRLRIAELEALVVSRQKEIFLLNGRLAAAESMTHDVIRDLLGVKLDMTNYVSVLNNQQLQKMTNKVQRRSSMEAEAKEVRMLKQQLDELIAEKQGWLEEINQKQATVMALQVSLEQCYQKDRLLTTEIEMIKMENMNHKRKVMELESDVKKLSGQQNIQQRIHHHAKIKEENNELKTHNEDLSAKLRRAEAILSRVKDELALYRLANGRCPYIDFDEEQKLSDKLKETEEERLQLAQKLLGMCNSILQTAGIEKQVHDTNLPVEAEEALKQLDDKIISLEREVWDLKFKNRISSERVRLSEMQLASSPLSSRRDDNYQTSRRESQPPFLPDFDR